MTKTLGLIGSGNIGSALARLALAAGLDVVLSNSRGPETLADAVDIGPLADSWRSQPGTPVHVQPYQATRPATQMSREEAYRWFLETPGVPVPANQVKDLIHAAAVHRTDESR